MEAGHSTAFSVGNAVNGGEELLALQPPTDGDASVEASGDTAQNLRHMDRESATSTPPMATSTPMRTLAVHILLATGALSSEMAHAGYTHFSELTEGLQAHWYAL